MSIPSYSALLQFLRDELALPETSIELAVRHCDHDSSLLPIILWQYGFITLQQLDQIFDWLAKAYMSRAERALLPIFDTLDAG